MNTYLPTYASTPPTTRRQATNRDGTLQSVQALRGIAALLVVIFHTGLRFDTTSNTFRIGNAGVDIFFVISGFVMFMVTDRRPTDPGTFLRDRCIRLVPLYWIATLGMIAAWAVMPALFPHTHPTLEHVLLSLAFVPHTSPDVGLVMPVLAQGWTLNFEALFYVLFALTLMLPTRRRLTALVTALLVLPMLGYVVRTPAVPATTLLSPLLIEFLGGVMLARLAASNLRVPARWCWASVVLGVALLAMAAPAADDEGARVLLYGVPALLIVGGLVGSELGGGKLGRVLGAGSLPRQLGDASYSIYLTHPFAIAAIGKLWPRGLPIWQFMTAGTLFSALVGIVVYRLVEHPLLTLMRRQRRSPSVLRPDISPHSLP